MNIFLIKDNKNHKEIKFMGIKLYEKNKQKEKIIRKFLYGLYKNVQQNKLIKKYIIGIKFCTKNLPMTFEEIQLIEEARIIEKTTNAQMISNLHQQIFPRFKNCNKDTSLVITGAGPSLKNYCIIKDAKHIALNRVFLNDKIKFDYIFAVDYKGIKDNEQELINYNCEKFLGTYINSAMKKEMRIPEYLMEKPNVYRFYSDNKYYKIKSTIFQDISSAPLMDFYSVAFCALHFAFWTHAKKIYLVGCDCKANGYFDNTKQRESIEQLNQIFKVVVSGYRKVKDFRDAYYPDVEIISVNPVGLKGMFKDVYTKSYIDEHPEIKKELEENIEIYDLNKEMCEV